MILFEGQKTDFASVSDDPDKVQLLYPSRRVTAARGSSLLLSCEALYHLEQCHHVHVAWFQGTTELTRPHKYLTTVNESFVGESETKRRQVETEILDLQLEDAGRFQCVALCAGEVSAMGHFVSIFIAGD